MNYELATFFRPKYTGPAENAVETIGMCEGICGKGILRTVGLNGCVGLIARAHLDGDFSGILTHFPVDEVEANIDFCEKATHEDDLFLRGQVKARIFYGVIGDAECKAAIRSYIQKLAIAFDNITNLDTPTLLVPYKMVDVKKHEKNAGNLVLNVKSGDFEFTPHSGEINALFRGRLV